MEKIHSYNYDIIIDQIRVASTEEGFEELFTSMNTVQLVETTTMSA
jgi:hypothetical protein